jgi:hypothetical protein
MKNGCPGSKVIPQGFCMERFMWFANPGTVTLEDRFVCLYAIVCADRLPAARTNPANSAKVNKKILDFILRPSSEPNRGAPSSSGARGQKNQQFSFRDYGSRQLLT